METEIDVHRELKNVRRLLKEYREREDTDNKVFDMLYGAQIALFWILGNSMSPSNVERLIIGTAELLEEEG